MLKVLFMGTPDFALESLKAIDEAGYPILGVVTNPDKPKGRGMKMLASPVKEYALQRKFPIEQPEKIKNNEELIQKIKNRRPDVICVVAYGKILPKAILEIPKYGCINVHGSLLPKYRGAAPIQWAVIHGEKVTGVTTMYMDVGMDTGDMILKEEVAIGEDETTGELWERLAKIGGKLLVQTLEQIENGTVKREKQGENFSIAPMLDKSIAKIDWENQTAKQIKDLVRGLNPMMGAYTFYEGKKIKLWRVKVLTEEEMMLLFPDLIEYSYKMKDIMPGTILFSSGKKGLYIMAKEGVLEIVEMQGENAKRMKATDFLRGNELPVGTVLKT